MQKTVSLKKNRDFQRTYRSGRYRAGKYIVVYICKNKFLYNRLGIATGKKFGNSVQRNRMKRIIKENYRAIEENIKVGYDIVVMARASKRGSATPANKLKAMEVPSFDEIKKELEKLIMQIGLL